MYDKYLTTEYPNIFFEDSAVGRMKKRIWDASEEEIDEILQKYEIPSEPEIGKAGCYIQTTPRAKVIEKRRKNDIVLVPLGCTENHGMHNNSGLDTFMCSGICEGVRRYTAKLGHEVALALPPLNYGGHPYHHLGMPGTIVASQTVVEETLIDVMLGLWDDGFRKIIFVNNHGMDWMLEAAVQEFFKRYQLPAFVTVVEWHRAVREFFYPIGDKRPDFVTTPFVHADESETSVALLMFKDMVDMSYVQDAQAKSMGFLDDGYYDGSVDSFHRPNKWSEAEGHRVIERFGTPEGVVGVPSRGNPRKAKRPIAAICEYLTMMVEDILSKYPAGTVPAPEKFSLRPYEEIKDCLKEPLSEGWKSVHELPRRGIFTD
ncbi:creatininase family protein [Enterocloster bolteae]|jgi:creatinine amidohydrolase/Fe(II)-dependent formamide hydrolase-like protein|uniref:3-dehydro-scyllo-inosose hydrolase n=1 Tax=Clostridia TaxID=186801 RepID=UPI001105EC3B|nr:MULTISPECIES: 3-dehydro-scyllo-inosose hydrolase [Clostridia]MCB7092900.1 creatininase family protein [Enterocloster bolteae]MCH1934739.1 creatininase family protein [Enterocloster sp. OA11]